MRVRDPSRIAGQRTPRSSRSRACRDRGTVQPAGDAWNAPPNRAAPRDEDHREPDSHRAVSVGPSAQDEVTCYGSGIASRTTARAREDPSRGESEDGHADRVSRCRTDIHRFSIIESPPIHAGRTDSSFLLTLPHRIGPLFSRLSRPPPPETSYRASSLGGDSAGTCQSQSFPTPGSRGSLSGPAAGSAHATERGATRHRAEVAVSMSRRGFAARLSPEQHSDEHAVGTLGNQIRSTRLRERQPRCEDASAGSGASGTPTLDSNNGVRRPQRILPRSHQSQKSRRMSPA